MVAAADGEYGCSFVPPNDMIYAQCALGCALEYNGPVILVRDMRIWCSWWLVACGML